MAKAPSYFYCARRYAGSGYEDTLSGVLACDNRPTGEIIEWLHTQFDPPAEHGTMTVEAFNRI